MPYVWEGNRRYGVALDMDLSGLSTCGLTAYMVSGHINAGQLIAGQLIARTHNRADT